MTSGSEFSPEVFRVSRQIVEATPDRCKPCFKPDQIADRIAVRVVGEEVTIEQGMEEQRQYLNENCPLGAAAEGSCVGNRLICGLGGRDITELEVMELELAIALERKSKS